MPEPNRSDPSYKVWNLCYHVRGQLELKINFMDNINVVNAIKSNDPAKLTSLAYEFISTFCNTISILFDGGRKGFITHDIMRYVDRQNPSFHLDLVKLRRISINHLIMIQFGLWSCVSEKCFRIITALLLNSRVEIKVDEEISWAWMENFVKCVTLTSKFVYNTYAADHQKQYPCCAMLLLAKSLFETSRTFVCLATNPNALSAMSSFYDTQKFKKRNEICALMAMTSSFENYCQQKAKEIICVKKEHSLEYFMEYENHIITTNRFLSSLQGMMDQGKLPTHTPPEQVLQFRLPKNLTKEELEKKIKENDSQQIGNASSTSVAHNMEHEVPSTKDPLLEKNKGKMEKKIKKIQKKGKISSTSGAHNNEDEVPTAKDPLLEETKFKKLHKWLLRLKKVLDENNGILNQLEKARVSKEDYFARCTAFSKNICPKDLGETSFEHFNKSLAFFGLMVHEVLKCGIHNKKMTKIQVSVFAPILFHSLDGVSPKTMATYQFWNAFLTKVVPKCITTNSSIRDASTKLRHFMGQCLNSIGDKGIEEVLFNSGNSPNECLAFYYEQNYLSNNTKQLVLQMKSNFEKQTYYRQSMQSKLVINSAGVLKQTKIQSKKLKQTKIQSKKNEDPNSELYKTTSSKRPAEMESTAIDDTNTSPSANLRKRIRYENNLYLKKRLRSGKDINRAFKEAKRRNMKSIAIDNTTMGPSANLPNDDTSPSANLRKQIRYENNLCLNKRLRSSKDSNKGLKEAKRRNIESMAIDDTMAPSANLRKHIRVAAKGRTKRLREK